MKQSNKECTKCKNFIGWTYIKKENQIGEYCKNCGRYNRWVPHDEAKRYKLEEDPSNKPLF